MDLNRTVPELDAWLDAYRTKSDDLADAAAAELIRAKALKGDWALALEHGGPACRRLYEQAHTVPSWVDFERMRAGAQLGLRTPVQSALALIMGSLMELYAGARGAKVLIRSGRLESQVIARLHDTTQFVLEIAASRGSRPGTYAHRHILRTRLVHAFIRHGMLKRGDWNAAAWGHPVNQEDYAGTLIAFSHVYLRSMERIGAKLTLEEEDSVHHGYRWVGWVMGVDEGLLTASRDEERVLYAHITRRNLHPDDDSRALARSLLAALDRRAPTFLPAVALAEISREMIGDPLGDALGLPRAPRWAAFGDRALPWLSSVQRTVERLPLARVPIELVGEQVARAVYKYGLRA
ncbi:MAG: DUF2236 domain-containing protein [Myxococcaceae bacterium]|nr:DUF2236 domain-containing protein [Myxococcaceae bacterium]